MASKRKISPAERRHQDYLRRKALKVGHHYEARLVKLRRKEVQRVLDLCRDIADPSHWQDVINAHLDESYLYGWFKGLYVDVGIPQARSVARDLSRGKASPTEGYWEQELLRYAEDRAGEDIVIVSGTLKDELIRITRTAMEADTQMGIEKLARSIYKDFSENLLLWQCRRIAQTETMIGLADAGAMAARSLEVPFLKQWCTSGLMNTRDSHLIMDGVTADMDEPFLLVESNSYMMYPHDKSMGAEAKEIINCACSVLRIPK